MRLVLEQVVKASRSAEMQNRAMKEKLQISIRELNSINDRIDEFKMRPSLIVLRDYLIESTTIKLLLKR